MIRLLDDSLQKYYWLGFLLADGSFQSQKRIKVALAAKDKEHLKKLQLFLQIETMTETNKKYPTVTISGMDTKIVQTLCTMYKIQSNKTINPPNLLSISGDNLRALAIGIIDGDGSISKFSKRKDAFIRIKIHSSWLEILNYLWPARAKINSKGYAEAVLSGWSYVKEWKKFALTKQLPILTRKWDKINLDYVNRSEKKKMKEKEIGVGGEI